MQSVKRTKREISRLVLTITMTCMMAVLLASCGTTGNGTAEVLQPRPHEHPHPEFTEYVDNRVNQMINEIDNRVGDIVDNRIQAIDNRIQEIDGRLDEWLTASGQGLDYRITYNFNNFDPVGISDQERAARERFFQDLTKWLDGARKEGFQVAYTPPQNTPVMGFIESIILENAQARSRVDGQTHQSRLEAEIRRLAERAGDPQLAVPVRRDVTPAPLLVQHVTVDHNATSGVGKAVAGCTRTVEIALGGVAKPGAVIDYVVAKIGDRIEEGVETIGDTIIHRGVPCEGLTTIQDYVLVTLINPVVAQYRRLDIEVNASGEVTVKSETQLPVPLTEGAPACPPPGIPDWAAGPFKGRLSCV